MLSPAMTARKPAFVLLQLEYKRTAHASSSTTRPRTPHLLPGARDQELCAQSLGLSWVSDLETISRGFRFALSFWKDALFIYTSIDL